MIEVLAFLAAISIASERVVEVLKNALNLSTRIQNEKRRVAVIHALAITSGATLAYFMAPSVAGLPVFFKTYTGYFVIGLMSGAGSSIWNSLLSIVTDLKGKIGERK